MKPLTKILFIAVLIMFSNGNSFGQIGLGNSQKPMNSSENFEHIDCGFRYPLPGKFTLSTSIGYSPYRDLGEGKINRFTSNLVTYDIGCIDLDDPPRKMKKNELISSLNSMTKAYLQDSSEFISLPVTTVSGKEIYEFKTKTDFLRRIKYILEGNRVLIFLARADSVNEVEEALKLFNSVKYFSVKETVEKRMETETRKSLPQSPALKLTQTDAAHNNLKGSVKSVRSEEEDVPVLVGTGDRRIRSDDTYDRNGNLLKNFWFQDSGYPTSVTIYGFVGGSRVSDSEEIDYDTTLRLTASGQSDIKLPPPDTRYEYRYEYKYDTSKRLIERKRYDNRGKLMGIYTFTYKDDLMEEKWFGADGKLNSTERRQLDKNGNELKYEFWWYEQTDKEVETYDYKKFDRFGNWTERRVVKKITDRGLIRTRTSNEFRTITYYGMKN
jgi:hypothetical protein